MIGFYSPLEKCGGYGDKEPERGSVFQSVTEKWIKERRWITHAPGRARMIISSMSSAVGSGKRGRHAGSKFRVEKALKISPRNSKRCNGAAECKILETVKEKKQRDE